MNPANVIITFGFAWTLLAIPFLLATIGLGYLIARFNLPQSRLFRRMHFGLFLAIALPVAGWFFGLATGYFNAWVDHRDWGDYNHPDLIQKWCDALAITGLPGDAVANAEWGDWQADEEWEYRQEIAIWNGLFWLITGLAAVPAIRFFTGQFTRPKPAFPNAVSFA